MRVQRITKQAYATIAETDSIHDGWGANQGILVAKEGTLVVDTSFTLPAARQLLREVERRRSSTTTLVVNTHDHSDHVFGNSVFQATSLIIAHANCRARLIQLGSERIRGYRRFDTRLNSALKGLRISPAQVSYFDDMKLMLGENEVRLIHPKDGAHTVGDTMVLVPAEKLLFAGDVVWANYHPNLEDANIEGWLRALDGISRMSIDFIVPGHGPLSDKSCIAPLATYLRRFDEGLRRLVRDHVPKSEVVAQLSLPGTDGWRLKMIVERNVDVLYDRYLDDSMGPDRSRDAEIREGL